MDGNWFSPQVVLQFKDLIALVTLVWLLVHTYTRTIPRIQSEFVGELRAVLNKLDGTLEKLTTEIRAEQERRPNRTQQHRRPA